MCCTDGELGAGGVSICAAHRSSVRGLLHLQAYSLDLLSPRNLVRLEHDVSRVFLLLGRPPRYCFMREGRKLALNIPTCFLRSTAGGRLIMQELS